MDLQQTKILLEKINALYKSISLNKGTISAIEQDLMLSYVRQLYEACLQTETPVVAPSLQQAPMVATEKEIPPPPKPQELEQPKKSYTPPKIIEIAEPPTPTVKKQEPILPPPAAFQQEPTMPPKPDSYNIRSIAPTAGAGKANFKALFDFKQAKELSEKLGDRPVSDLTKAFAINDKLLYINELFSKDADSFNESLKLLNKFDGMDEAKSLLISLAEQYNWIHEEKVEIAQTFIRVIRRRYV